jgi:hypothetical protein
MAALREAVESYQASCVVSYPEDRWQDDPYDPLALVKEAKWSDTVPEKEKRVAVRWMSQHGHNLPSEDAGDDHRIDRYKFTMQATDDLDERLDDRDGVDFMDTQEEESEHRDMGSTADEEKARAYLGLTSTLDTVTTAAYPSLESSGTLQSTWHLVERVLGDFYRGGNLTPEQFVRLERKSRPVRKQWRNGRASNTNWKSATGTNFYSQRCEAFLIWDAVATAYRDLLRWSITDEVALDAERRRLTKGSARPKAATVMHPEPQPYVGPPLAILPAKDHSAAVFPEWLRSGNYEGLVAYRSLINDGS